MGSIGYYSSQNTMGKTAALAGWAEPVLAAFKKLEYGHIGDRFLRGRSLDIGCGTAFLTKTLQDAGVDAYGIDPDREAIEYGMKNYKFRNPSNLRVASMTGIPFHDEHFYTVTTCHIGDIVNYNIGTRVPFPNGDKSKAAREVCRVLEKDGLYIAYDAEPVFDFSEDMEFLAAFPSTHSVVRIWKKK